MSSGGTLGMLEVTVPPCARLVSAPHTDVCPPPPHVWSDGQLPQFPMIGFPQLSLPLTVPQFLPTRSQNAAFPSLTHAASPSETPTSGVAASSRSPRASLTTSFDVARSVAPDSASPPDPAAPSFASPPVCPLASTLPAPPPLLVPALPP